MVKKKVESMRAMTLKQLLRAVREFRKKARVDGVYKRAMETPDEPMRQFGTA